jgi:hypothetical protein
MPIRCPAAATLLALLLLQPLAGGAQPLPDAGVPGTGAGAGNNGAAGSGGMSPKEKEVLERIRLLKTPRWRSFGPCRYDWGGWRLSEGGVRSTAVECGDPPLKGSVAVHCDTLRVNRRSEEGAWESWRLPQSVAESSLSGGEDLMVAALCANVRPAAPPAGGARPSTPPTTPPGIGTPPVPATRVPATAGPKPAR